MGKLQHALEWAARGFRVFPLRENGKQPVVPNFGQAASNDAAVITAWWRDTVTGQERDYNIGVLTTDMVVADVDLKDGRPGLDTYGAHGGHFDTLTVRTPTGGYHCYFYGPDSSLSPLGPGLDIRSHNGYVIAPGSTINGQAYTLAVDADVAWVPRGIEDKLRPPGRRAERDDALVDLDTPTAIANAKAWLLADAPVAEQGNRDNTAYYVSARLVRDYALTEETAFYLLVNHWNARLTPPLDAAELWRKVENAAQYGLNALGSSRPELDFGSVVVVDPTPERLQTINGFGNALALSDIPVRPWLIHRLLMRRDLTVLAAAGSAGKSVLALTVAAHLAMGRSIGRFTCKAPARSFIYNAEDDIAEQSRRLIAICQEYGFDYEYVKDRILLVSGKEVELTLATKVQYSAVANQPHIDWIKENIKAPDIGLCVLDPLVDLHTCDETDNGQMRVVMRILQGIASETDTALLIPHHTSKPGAQSGSRAGNVDASRGASAITNKARIVMTIFGATDQDREVYGITEEEKHRFLRLDDAKMNMALASSESTWFRKHGVRLYNSDEVGVLMEYNMGNNALQQARFIALVVRDHMIMTGTSYVSLKQAAALMEEADVLYARMGITKCRNAIERALRSGVQLDEGKVTLERETNAQGKDTTVIKWT